VSQSDPGTSGRIDVTETGARRLLIIAGVMAAALMQTLDGTITNVALPTIQGNLGASQDEGTWIITAYTIASIVIIPITPWLQNRFGRKRYFLASIIGFTLASIACGASESLTMLIVSRLIQGVFGGGLLATGQAIMRDTFPPSQLAASQGIFALGAIMGPALGPPLGGILVDNFSWNWCFDINVVPGVFSTVILFLLLRDPARSRQTPIDAVGLALLATTLGTLQYILTEGEQNYWFQDSLISTMSLISVVAFAFFVWWELTRTSDPIVDLRIFRNRSVWAGSILGFALGASVYGSSYVLPQFTQGVLGFTPTLSGMLFIFRAVPIGLVTPISVRLSGKVDPRIMLGLGFAAVGLGSYLQATVTVPNAPFWDFVGPLMLTGVGSALLWVPLSVAVLGGTPARDGAKAGAFINLALQLGGSVSVAGLAVLLHGRETFHANVINGSLTLANPVVRDFLAHISLGTLAQLAEVQSTTVSFADVTYAIALIAFVCIPLILLMKRRKQAAPAGPVHIEIG
jgi:DHA2 family multidrug resistance protein